MKRSELIKKLTALAGEDDIDIYLKATEHDKYNPDFQIILDHDGDIIIKP